MSVRKSARVKSRVVWDEDNLEYLEANKSPKKKITEPKTPYHAPEDSDGAVSDDSHEGKVRFNTAVDPEAVKSALSQVACSSNGNGKRYRKSSGWTSSEDDDDDYHHKDLEEHRRFAEMRKAHYDEFRRLKMLRSKGSAWQDEEEEQDANDGKTRESRLADAVCAIDIQANTQAPMET